MLNSVKSPILPTRGANRNAFYSITVDRRQLGQDRGVMVSEAAARDVSPTGITSNGYGFNIDSVGRDRIYYWKDHEIVSRKFPAVNFFTIKGAMHRLLVSRSELNDMGKVFRVPADYLDEATFVFEPGNAFKGRQVFIQPRWEELIDPKWKKSFLRWVAGSRALPDPDSIENWKTWGNRLISMPGIPQVRDFYNGESCVISGRLTFRSSERRPVAYYDYQEGVTHCYALQHEKKGGNYSIEYLGTKFKEETFERWTFERLLGEKPSLKRYIFTKVAKKTGFHIASTGGFVLALNAPKDKVKLGEKYTIKAQRKGDIIFLSCFTSRGELIGKTSVPLVAGMPNCMGVTFK